MRSFSSSVSAGLHSRHLAQLQVQEPTAWCHPLRVIAAEIWPTVDSVSQDVKHSDGDNLCWRSIQPIKRWGIIWLQEGRCLHPPAVLHLPPSAHSQTRRTCWCWWAGAVQGEDGAGRRAARHRTRFARTYGSGAFWAAESAGWQCVTWPACPVAGKQSYTLASAAKGWFGSGVLGCTHSERGGDVSCIGVPVAGPPDCKRTLAPCSTANSRRKSSQAARVTASKQIYMSKCTSVVPNVASLYSCGPCFLETLIGSRMSKVTVT